MTLPLALPAAPDLDHVFELVGEARWRRLAGERVLVTGGTGFIGKWLVASLLDADRRMGLGCSVSVLTRDPRAAATSMPTSFGEGAVEWIDGDIRSVSLRGDCRFVLHAATDVVASNPPLTTFETCVLGTRSLFDAVSGRAEHVLLTSSGAVYGRQPATIEHVPEGYAGAPDVCDPKSAYGEGKRAAEWLGCAYAETGAFRFKIARCFSFVGPYLPLDKHFAIGNFLGDALADRPIRISGDGTPLRSYMYAADMAAWLWTVLFDGRSGRPYNVGSDEAVSIEALARSIERVVGPNGGVRRSADPDPHRTPERYVPDVTRALTELGLPRPIGLDESIARTASWQRSCGSEMNGG